MKFLSRLALMLVLVLPLYAQTQTFPAEDMSNTFTGTNINGAVTRNGNGAGGNIPDSARIDRQYSVCGLCWRGLERRSIDGQRETDDHGGV